MKNFAIKFDRLRNDIEELSKIGRDKDDFGINRMAFTDADMEARHWLQNKIEKAGLKTWMDGAGNVFGSNNKDKKDSPSILLGSHTDTVPCAGHLDGSLGVLCALECLRSIHEENIPTKYPIEIVSFSDEEGRFGGLFGSQALCGEITPESIHHATDLNGIRRADEMLRHGLEPMQALHARRAPESLHAYLELHIEQGPVLDTKKIPIGVVSEITGLFTWRVRLIGNADHAGTTPMHMRKDAFNGLAEFAGEIHRILEEHGSDHSVATIGKVELSPGTTNTVPGMVEFSLDVRDTSQSILDDLSDAFRRTISAIARRRQLMFEFDINSEVTPVQCSKKIIDTITNAAEELNFQYLVMPSGAAHDAQIMSHITNVGMIFVPSKGGKSHSPAEWTHWEDIETGANLMLKAALKLAEA